MNTQLTHKGVAEAIVAIKPITIFTGKHVSKFYPVILEGYNLVKRSGSKRRKYESAFTEEERAWIKDKVETTWYRWNFVTGVPQEVEMKNDEYTLMVEATNFFATI